MNYSLIAIESQGADHAKHGGSKAPTHLVRELWQRSFDIGSMAFMNSRRKTKLIPVVVIGSLIAQAVPAFAEKITLACSRGPGYVTNFWTFDLNAKTVKDPEWDPNGNTHPIQVTDDEISWSAGGGKRIYTLSTSQLTIYEETPPLTVSCQRAPRGPL
jgi:hypothetical protein